jgi:hypothetical protein
MNITILTRCKQSWTEALRTSRRMRSTVFSLRRMQICVFDIFRTWQFKHLSPTEFHLLILECSCGNTTLSILYQCSYFFTKEHVCVIITSSCLFLFRNNGRILIKFGMNIIATTTWHFTFYIKSQNTQLRTLMDSKLSAQVSTDVRAKKSITLIKRKPTRNLTINSTVA